MKLNDSLLLQKWHLVHPCLKQNHYHLVHNRINKQNDPTLCHNRDLSEKKYGINVIIHYINLLFMIDY